jgi:transcriptional regulator with XRE-family HTH domain
MAGDEAAGKPPGLLAQRLQHLYDTVRPPGRDRPYSDREVADGVNAAVGEKVTGRTYVYQLRKGPADNPRYKVVLGLSRFFGVPPTYFFSEKEMQRSELPPETVALLHDDSVRDLALRAAGLSEQSREAIRQMVENARTMEGKG